MEFDPWPGQKCIPFLPNSCRLWKQHCLCPMAMQTFHPASLCTHAITNAISPLM